MRRGRKEEEILSDEDAKKRRLNMIPKAAIKNIEKWDRTLRSYLEGTGAENTQYWYYPDDELGSILAKFWLALKMQRVL